jgi:hypothetical protein
MSDPRILTLRQADQARTDFALIENDLEFIAGRLARLPTRRDLAMAALRIIVSTAALVILWAERFGACEGGGGTRRQASPGDRRPSARGREVMSARRRTERDSAPRRPVRESGGSSRPAGGIDDRDARRMISVAPKLVSLIVAIAVAISSTAPSAREYRSREVTREFQREHPCPSTGRTTGPCPGYRRDHVESLACDGPDAVSNMQWQTIRDAKAKDLRPLTRAASSSLSTNFQA